jgi:hypothetical protein
MKRDPLTSRYSVCLVGNGYSVEDRRTGKRLAYFASRGAAEREAQRLSEVVVEMKRKEEKNE